MNKPRDTALLRAAQLPARLLAAEDPAQALDAVLASAIELSGATRGAIVMEDGARIPFGATCEETLVVPLVARGERLGALVLEAGPLDESQVRLVEAVAANATLALLARRERPDEDLVRVEKERIRARTRRLLHRSFPELVGESTVFLAFLRELEKVCPSDLPVLIQGESGTGKELVARAIHARGPRPQGPYIALNVPELPELLIESILFGHVKGAFTNAFEDKLGVIREADGGTLLLDEVGDLPLTAQVKLLRFLQEQTVRPLGATREVRVSVRVIAATNKDLEAEVAAGRFREDLYFRLNKLGVFVPPLRARQGDALVLARHFVARGVAGKSGGRALSEAAVVRLGQHEWPGNVRELENAVWKALTVGEGPITPEQLGLAPPRAREGGLLAAEREELLRAVREAGSLELAARELGVHRVTLWKKLKKHGISVERRRPAG